MSTIVLSPSKSSPLKRPSDASPLKRPISASPMKLKSDCSPPKRPQPDRFILKFKKLTPEATRPSKASEHAAGYDLFAAYDTLVPAKGKALVKTDLQLQIPDGCYGRIAPRSGLALKHSIDVGAGVIDADYRGNVGVILFNFGESDFQVNKGDRIAQLICEKIAYPELEEADENEELEATNRGANGFGSSGMN